MTGSAVRLLAAWAVLGHAVLAAVRPEVGLAALGVPRPWSGVLPWVFLLVVLLSDLRGVRRVGRLVGVEWEKLVHGRLFRVALGATAAATLLAAFSLDRLPLETGWGMAARTSGTALFAAEVFLLVLGATAISGEATGGTLKMIVPHAYRRSDWILAKSAVLVVAALALALVALGVALGHAAAAQGLGDVVKESDPVLGADGPAALEVFASSATMRTHFAESGLAALGALVTTSLLGVLLSCVFPGVVPSLCAAFLLFGLLESADVLLELSREARSWVYGWYPDELRETTARLGRAINAGWDDALLPTGLGVSLATGVLALLLAIHVFARRDLGS